MRKPFPFPYPAMRLEDSIRAWRYPLHSGIAGLNIALILEADDKRPISKLNLSFQLAARCGMISSISFLRCFHIVRTGSVLFRL
jgi:hypothetical protein